MSLTFSLNGRIVNLPNVDPTVTIADWLRDSGVTGTKIGCGEGGCGACAVMLSRYDAEAKHVTTVSVNGCLRKVVTLHH